MLTRPTYTAILKAKLIKFTRIALMIVYIKEQCYIF